MLYADLNSHSLNPYSIIHFNFLLDYICKPNIEHHLHHIIGKYYYILNSFRHFDRKLRDEDVKKYNSLLGTNVSFDLWI